MDLIIATILGSILFGIRAKEKSADRVHKQKVETSRQVIDRWTSKVEDLYLEAQLRNFVEDPANRDKVREEVDEVYDRIFAKNIPLEMLVPRDLWTKPRKGETAQQREDTVRRVSRLSDKNALRIMMAKRGKICQFDAERSVLRYISKRRYCGIDDHCQIDAHVLMWCAEELKKHGVNEPFLIDSIGPYGCSGMRWELS